jgi:hypothetical protein
LGTSQIGTVREFLDGSAVIRQPLHLPGGDDPCMPSFQHEALLQLFRNRPLLAPTLLRDALHESLPEFTEVRVDSAELNDIQPAEYTNCPRRDRRQRQARR